MKKNIKRALLLVLTMALAATLACCTSLSDDSSSSLGGASENSSQESSESSENSESSESSESSENSSESDSSSTQTPTEPTKAKVIVLAGQSNAVGHSYAKYLDATAQTKYANGFDNVQIYYSNYPYSTSGSMNVNDEGFTKVTLGQGRNVDTTEHVYGNFGPEVGLAEYLSETYPEETFYIIKDATGGTRIWDRWYSPSSYGYRGGEAENSLYAHMMDWVDDGMELLEAQGYDAEIVSFAWMQGESDSLTYVQEYGYLWSNFVTDIKAAWSEKGYLPENGLSIIDAGITDYWTNYTTMNAVKKAYADISSKNYFIDVHNSNWVSYDQDNTDYAHLDASAMIALGRAFGENVKNAIEDLDNAEEYTYTGTGWDGFTKATLTGAGTETDPYLISTEAELATLALNVKDGDTYAGKFIKLANDITIVNPCFTGIGGANGNYNAYDTIIKRAFAGTFDGDNKTVTVDLLGPSFTGLFRGNTGTVKNLTVAGSVTGGWYDVGAVVSYNYGGTVYNCVNTATLTSNYTDSMPFHYGGVVGYSYGGTIENCSNLAEIRMDGHTLGGVVGYAGYDALVKGCVNGSATDVTKGVLISDYELGGIVGILGTKVTDGSKLENCINYASITATGKSVGGIAGAVYAENVVDGCKNYGSVSGVGTDEGGVGGIAGRQSNAVVKNCVNGYSASELSADTSLTNGTVQNGGLATGGITGRMMTTAGGKIVACINYMNVTGANNQVGGVIGSMWVGASVDGCDNYGMIESEGKYAGGILGYCNTKTPTVKNNDNYGNVSANTGAGGIVGLYNVAGTYTIENCHNYATITGTSQYGGVVGRVGNYAINLTVIDCSSNGSYVEADVIGSAGANATVTVTTTTEE